MSDQVQPIDMAAVTNARCAHTMKATGRDGKTRCCDCGKIMKQPVEGEGPR